MKMIVKRGLMRTQHRFDGHVVRRTMAPLRRAAFTAAEARPEPAHACFLRAIRDAQASEKQGNFSTTLPTYAAWCAAVEAADVAAIC
jgi:hypothetical protein